MASLGPSEPPPSNLDAEEARVGPMGAVAVTTNNSTSVSTRKRGPTTATGAATATAHLHSAAASSASRRRRRTTTTKKGFGATMSLRERITAVIFFSVSILYMYFLWRTQEFLDSIESRSAASGTAGAAHNFGIPKWLAARVLNRKIKEEAKPQATYKYEDLFQYENLGPPPDKFLVFHVFAAGQGAGNIMNGLLAAHLFAAEFNRTVCVHSSYQHFHMAFEPVHPHILSTCPQVLATYDEWENHAFAHGLLASPNHPGDALIEIVNYYPDPIDECALKELLQNSTQRILKIQVNTYPRWPVIPFEKFFFYFYKPKAAFLQVLPYDPLHPPSTVVHLRAPDGDGDNRKGLDNNTLALLKESLPEDTYLVTNRVLFYDFFPTWAHPPWNEVKHSAFGKSWGDKHGDIAGGLEFQNQDVLHMWADWYTVLTADKVIHTHSDFSISAIHWVDSTATSRTILGLNGDGQSLYLVEESWKVDGETARLIDRTRDAEGTQKLRNCFT